MKQTLSTWLTNSSLLDSDIIFCSACLNISHTINNNAFQDYSQLDELNKITRHCSYYYQILYNNQDGVQTSDKASLVISRWRAVREICTTRRLLVSQPSKKGWTISVSSAITVKKEINTCHYMLIIIWLMLFSTLYTLWSVSTFSILFSKHFLRYWQENLFNNQSSSGW